jgi:phosphate transport system ATP-binding protein
VAGTVRIDRLTASYGARKAVADISMLIEPKQITALIGPSGCGKSTLLRCINALHLTIPGASTEGQILLDEVDVLRDIDPVQLRRRVGMVFQRPNPFPTMSIYENVVAGLRLGHRRGRNRGHDQLVERCLTAAGLWEEVKHRLRTPGAGLSGGQQQRLCIARALAVEPDVLLMDEPCSALDPISTATIEDTMGELKDNYTIVIVTHNMQQSSRVSDYTAFFNLTAPGEPGRLIELGPTATIFSQPSQKATEDYISGKFG